MNQNPNPGIQFQTVSNGMSIFTDNLKIAKHMILTWQKKAQHIKLKMKKKIILLIASSLLIVVRNKICDKGYKPHKQNGQTICIPDF
jgi:hypothetical protein